MKCLAWSQASKAQVQGVRAGDGLAARGGMTGAFFSGALATVAATPCTAPFMGAAVGYAVTRPWAEALVIFQALGLGLALPYLALSVMPAWRRSTPGRKRRKKQAAAERPGPLRRQIVIC